MRSKKEARIREALAALGKINPTGDEIAAYINGHYGTNYTGTELAQFMRYGVRGIEKRRPLNHNNGEKNTYRLVA